MPTYDYQCTACLNSFVQFLSISNRDAPVKSACPNCKKKKVVRVWLVAPVGGVDKTLSPGSDFKELMGKMSAAVPARYRENLHRAASLRGGNLGTQ